MKYQLNDKPGLLPMIMYGLQWWIVSIPCVVIMGIIVAQLHTTAAAGQIFYMQKLFAIMGLSLTVQLFWGHRLPVIIGPASVLLIGILSAISTGPEAVYTSIAIGGAVLAVVAYSGLLARLQVVFTPRIIIVILCLIAFTLAPVILKLLFSQPQHTLLHLFFALLLALGMIIANRILKGIWKSTVVLIAIIAGSLVYYALTRFPTLSPLTPMTVHTTWFISPTFDPGTILAFLFCFIALTVNELGSIQAVGQMLDADRMQQRTTCGIGITGLSNILSGSLGIIGPVDYSMSPGIIAATGCASRYPLIPAGIGLIICAFSPGFIQVLNNIPPVIMGTVLLYLMASQLSAGMQLITRTSSVSGFNSGIIIGFPLMIALILSFAPEEVVNTIPALVRPIIGNGFVMGVMAVLILEHLIFREKPD